VKLHLEHEGIDVVTETTTKLINQRGVKAILEYLKYLYFGQDIYKYNFFALIEREVEDIPKVDFNTNRLLDIVKNAIEQYSLYDSDANLLRFLSTVDTSKDIEALLFEYERIDTSAAASELHGVRVLTVHKSKGLEYEHVIVIDRLKGVPPARESIIYEYDGIYLQNIYLRIKDRDKIDSQYAMALEKEKQLIKEDKLNALYVAFTRARDNLFIITKSEKSEFDLLELEFARYGELVCERIEEDEKLEYKPIPYQELYYGTQSDLLSLEKESKEELKAINFGIAMHYALEMMASFEFESLANTKSMLLNKFGFLLEGDEFEDILHRVTMLLENKKFLELTRGVCYKEKALRFKNSLRYIDLLVKHDSGVWKVIDYKSSMAYSDEHLKQVRYYIGAIRTITQEEVHGYICYMLEESIKLVQV